MDKENVFVTSEANLTAISFDKQGENEV